MSVVPSSISRIFASPYRLAHLIVPALLVVRDVEIHDFSVTSSVNEHSLIDVSHG